MSINWKTYNKNTKIYLKKLNFRKLRKNNNSKDFSRLR